MSDGRQAVLDASPLLAYLYGETGAETVRDALAIGCWISSVNWSEVLAKVAEVGDSAADLVETLRESRLLGTSLLVETSMNATPCGLRNFAQEPSTSDSR